MVELNKKILIGNLFKNYLYLFSFSFYYLCAYSLWEPKDMVGGMWASPQVMMMCPVASVCGLQV